MVRFDAAASNALASVTVTEDALRDHYDVTVDKYTTTDTNGVETVKKFEDVRAEVEKEVRLIESVQGLTTGLYSRVYGVKAAAGKSRLDEIAAEACRNSGFSEGAVVGVVTELQDILKQKLTEGQTVVLPGIGRFSLRVESIGVDDPKAFNIRQHITRVVCGFLPAGRRIQGRHILYDFCDGVKAVWQKGFKP